MTRLACAAPERLSSAHHELRTPLTSIRSFTEILLRYPVEDQERRRQFLRIIQDEAERLTRAVEGFLGESETVACPAVAPSEAE